MNHSKSPKGRGAVYSPNNRYSELQRDAIDDGWYQDPCAEQLRTELLLDSSKRIITYNRSPDVPVDRSINPYRGCEHGCFYCFARPTHAWLDLSPGLDFESKIFYKPDAPVLLKKELAHKNYRCAPLALGINTDAYQPVERQLGLTREILEVLLETKHPFDIVTKSALIERDIDLLADAAAQGIAHVTVSVTTLDRELSRRMEPRATAPQRRLETIKRLTDAGIPVSVLFAPVIPVLNDHEMETILAAVCDAGAVDAGYIMLRLPHELDEMVIAWLEQHEPLKARHIMQRIRDLRGGKYYDASFGQRMTGTGIFAELIAKRFKQAYQKLDFPGAVALKTTLFTPPSLDGQMKLF